MNKILLMGVILGLGYLIGKITHKIKITSVVGYILVGVLFGPHLFNLFNPSEELIHIITVGTLALIAFEIGVNISPQKIDKIGKKVVGITVFECSFTFIITAIGMYLVTRSIIVASILGSLAAATAPASRMAIIREYRARGNLTDTVIAIVGLDDALGVTFFTITLALTKASMNPIPITEISLNALMEIFGPILLGVIGGLLITVLLRRFEGDEELFIGVLTAILLVSGLAEYWNIDWILACMSLGIIFVTFSRDKAEKAKEFIQNRVLDPIFVIFFVIVGVSMEIDLLLASAGLASIYVISRSLGKIIGGGLGSNIFNASGNVQKYIGISLLSQAGVAVGLALTVSKELPNLTSGGIELGSFIVTIIAASTIIFEIVGTISFRYVLTKTGEANKT
ncbi:hypothetical protein C9439_05455 [archaeon SCG-AAA382B04]|nr:hypothetical protein C9439_05455 [archaeon SCG-AAA382B04]